MNTISRAGPESVSTHNTATWTPSLVQALRVSQARTPQYEHHLSCRPWECLNPQHHNMNTFSRAGPESVSTHNTATWTPSLVHALRVSQPTTPQYEHQLVQALRVSQPTAPQYEHHLSCRPWECLNPQHHNMNTISRAGPESVSTHNTAIWTPSLVQALRVSQPKTLYYEHLLSHVCFPFPSHCYSFDLHLSRLCAAGWTVRRCVLCCGTRPARRSSMPSRRPTTAALKLVC